MPGTSAGHDDGTQGSSTISLPLSPWGERASEASGEGLAAMPRARPASPITAASTGSAASPAASAMPSIASLPMRRAWQRDEYWATTTILGTAYRESVTRDGWTIGGGEIALGKNLSAFVEYAHYDFGDPLIGLTPHRRPPPRLRQAGRKIGRRPRRREFQVWGVGVAASEREQPRARGPSPVHTSGLVIPAKAEIQ